MLRTARPPAISCATPLTIAAAIWPSSPPCPRRFIAIRAGLPSRRSLEKPSGITNAVSIADRSKADSASALLWSSTVTPFYGFEPLQQLA